MKIVEESTDDIYVLMDMNIYNKAEFYHNNVVNFIKLFYEDHIKHEKGDKWNTQTKLYFEYLFNANKKDFFSLSVFLILLSKSDKPNQKAYAEAILKLAKRFKIEIKGDREISRPSFDLLLFNYIKYVSTDAVSFVKNLTNNPIEFNEYFAKSFGEDPALMVRKELLEGSTNPDFIDVYDFIDRKFFKMHHSEIRQRLSEVQKAKQ